MPNSSLNGFIPKSQAVEEYCRSPRQLTRDINDAIRKGASKILKNFKLLTDDGVVQEGVAIKSVQTVVDLKKSGKNPMWFIREEWLLEKFGKRLEERSTEPEEDISRDASSENTNTTSYSSEYVALLQDQIADLKKDKEKFDKTLEKSNELQGQLHVLLNRLLLLLPESSNTPPPVDTVVQDAETTTASPDSGMHSPNGPSEDSRKEGTQGRNTKSKTSTGKKQAKPKWNDFPTFKRFFS